METKMPWFEKYLSYPPFYTQYACAERGRRLFKEQCANCHTVTDDEKHSPKGPSLKNVYKRSPASIPGWEFSEANKDVSCRWGEKQLFEYLKDPKKFMPGTTMRHDGLKKSQDRVDLIEYLKSISDKKK